MNCLFGLRCNKKDCTFSHYERLRKQEASYIQRMLYGELFDNEMTPGKLDMVPIKTGTRRKIPCRYSLLCYERECPYGHFYNTSYELLVDCRIWFKNLLQKEIKKQIIDEKIQDDIKKKEDDIKKMKDDIKKMKEGKSTDWNDLL